MSSPTPEIRFYTNNLPQGRVVQQSSISLNTFPVCFLFSFLYRLQSCQRPQRRFVDVLGYVEWRVLTVSVVVLLGGFDAHGTLDETVELAAFDLLDELGLGTSDGSGFLTQAIAESTLALSGYCVLDQGAVHYFRLDSVVAVEDHGGATDDTLLPHDLEEVGFLLAVDAGEVVLVFGEECVASLFFTVFPDGSISVTFVARLATDDHVFLDVSQVVIDSIEGELLRELLVAAEASFVLLEKGLFYPVLVEACVSLLTLVLLVLVLGPVIAEEAMVMIVRDGDGWFFHRLVGDIPPFVELLEIRLVGGPDEGLAGESGHTHGLLVWFDVVTNLSGGDLTELVTEDDGGLEEREYVTLVVED